MLDSEVSRRALTDPNGVGDPHLLALPGQRIGYGPSPISPGIYLRSRGRIGCLGLNLGGIILQPPQSSGNSLCRVQDNPAGIKTTNYSGSFGPLRHQNRSALGQVLEKLRRNGELPVR